MRKTSWVGALAALLFACGAPQETPGKDVPELARRVADAMGYDRWRTLKRLRFTWKHKSGRVRSYDWRLREGMVTVSMGTPEEGQTSATIRADGQGLDESQVAFHKTFVNDSYWFVFPFLILEDGSTVRDLGERSVPEFDALGRARALEVGYGKDEGYTGGDRYVLYVGKDDLPVAWAFHRGGGEKPTLVTTRTPRRLANGISLPTRFETPDGAVFIEISDVTAE